MGFFGTPVVVEEYKPIGTNPFLEYKRVLEGHMPDENLLVPVFQWFSNHPANIRQMQFINERFFTADKTVLARYLTLNIDRRIRFIKYPKKSKEAKEQELLWLIPYICRLYGWSEREYQYHTKLINLEDPELHALLHQKFAFEPGECRKLGIKVDKVKAKYEAVPKVRGFF